MLRSDEYRIILAIERARDHRAVLAALVQCAAQQPVRSEEYRERLVDALRWARERVRSRDRQQLLKSMVAVKLGRKLLRTLSTEHPAERAMRTEEANAVGLSAYGRRSAANVSVSQPGEALELR